MQKHLGMVGKMVNGKEMRYGHIQNSEVTDVSIAGNVLVLIDIMHQLGLEELLNNYTDNQGKWIAALVLAHCTNPTSLNRMKRWCKHYGAADLLDIHPDECKKDRFYRALDRLNAKSIMQIEKELFERIRRFVRKRALFYDVTSTYFCGTNCRIGKSGYNPQGLGLPQINIGLAVTKPHSFPIFHQVYDGIIKDVRSIDQALRSLRDFGIKQTTIVWDRGLISKDALSGAKDIKLKVISGLPLKGQLKEKAIKMREGIATLKNRVRLSTQILYARGFAFEVYGHKGKLIICSNEKERAVLKELRYDEIENAIRRWKKGLKIKERIKKYLNGDKIDEYAVAQAELTDGLYALFSTNPSLSTKETVKTYFQKDRIEKAFKCLKGMIRVRPVRHWLSERVKAHVFICYLSYALFSMLDWKLKSAGLDMSINSALDLLEGLYRVRIRDPETGNSFVKHSFMSKEQEAIFKAVDEGLIRDVV
ncbi:MAG: transposase [Deltaproteobacteria bacterium]|nr:transposase [Deltaproteobacteria bacterium]